MAADSTLCCDPRENRSCMLTSIRAAAAVAAASESPMRTASPSFSASCRPLRSGVKKETNWAAAAVAAAAAAALAVR